MTHNISHKGDGPVIIGPSPQKMREEDSTNYPRYMIWDSDLNEAVDVDLMASEIPQCPRCQLYTDDPEHYCGSVALVVKEDTPQAWRDHWTFYFFRGFFRARLETELYQYRPGRIY